MKKKIASFIMIAVSAITLILGLSVFAYAASRISIAAVLGAEEAPKKLELPETIAMIAGAAAVVGSTMASAFALKHVAIAGFAAAAEKPELATWLLIMGGLAEGIAIYGLLLGIMILGKI
jgi:V/A-type H+-transporting ATPase subunit K